MPTPTSRRPEGSQQREFQMKILQVLARTAKTRERENTESSKFKEVNYIENSLLKIYSKLNKENTLGPKIVVDNSKKINKMEASQESFTQPDSHSISRNNTQRHG